MKKALSIILIVISVILLSSCTAEAASPDESSAATWEGRFLQYWNSMNMEYVHFSEETDLDWDEVYKEYLPLFQKLDFSKSEDSLKAFEYFKEIAINVDDGHYRIIIRDNFENCLMMEPVRERKWAENTGNSYKSFPDVLWNLSNPSQYMSVDKKYEIPADTGDFSSFFEESVEGYSEVKKLTDNTSFHGGTTSFKAYKTSSFATYSKDDSESKLTKQKDAWNYVVKAFDIDGFSYFYGVTEDYIFYFYFPYFISYTGAPLSQNLLYKSSLTDNERNSLDSDYQEFYDYLWNTSSGYNLTGDIKKFEGIYEMFEALKSIGKTGKCTMTDTDGNEQTYDIAGVIMDVRGNMGGANSTLETIFGYFFSSETKFAEARYKDGYSRYEYGPWIDMSIEQRFCTADDDYDKPFVVLTNGTSISCAELSASIAKNLMKNGAVIGNTTFGGTCTMAQRSLYHSGSSSSKYVDIQTTTTQTKLRTKDGTCVSFEGKGIEPDKIVAVDETYTTDERFASAVQWVNEHKTN